MRRRDRDKLESSQKWKASPLCVVSHYFVGSLQKNMTGVLFPNTKTPLRHFLRCTVDLSETYKEVAQGDGAVPYWFNKF